MQKCFGKIGTKKIYSVVQLHGSKKALVVVPSSGKNPRSWSLWLTGLWLFWTQKRFSWHVSCFFSASLGARKRKSHKLSARDNQESTISSDQIPTVCHRRTKNETA